MAISFTGAVVPIRGVELLVVVVRPSVLDDPYEAELVLLGFELRFVRPVVLIAIDAGGLPTYRSRGQWARLIGKVPLGSMPWQRFTLPAAM